MSKEHIAGFDMLRVLAAMAIIYIHLPVQASLYFQFVHAAVPLFAMMAGFLIVWSWESREFVFGDVLAKQFKRLMVPYLFWALVYWFLNNVIYDPVFKGEPLTVPCFIPLLKSFLLGGTAPHLWFLPSLFYSQLILSFVFLISRGIASIKLSFLVAFLLLGLAGSCFINATTSTSFSGYLKLYFCRLMVFFALGGLYYFFWSKIKNTTQPSRMVRLLLVAIMVVIYLLVLNRIVTGLIWPFIFIASALFWWVLMDNLKPYLQSDARVKLSEIGAFIAKQTMGIYLIHVIYTTIASVACQKINLCPLSPLMAIGVTVIVFVVSAVSVVVMRRIPALKKVVI